MATIMEGALWTLTEAAAERMVENGLLVRCNSEHCNTAKDLVESDLPIYHFAVYAPSWFGIATLHQAIMAAEAHVELEKTRALVKEQLTEAENKEYGLVDNGTT